MFAPLPVFSLKRTGRLGVSSFLMRQTEPVGFSMQTHFPGVWRWHGLSWEEPGGRSCAGCAQGRGRSCGGCPITQVPGHKAAPPATPASQSCMYSVLAPGTLWGHPPQACSLQMFLLGDPVSGDSPWASAHMVAAPLHSPCWQRHLQKSLCRQVLQGERRHGWCWDSGPNQPCPLAHPA